MAESSVFSLLEFLNTNAAGLGVFLTGIGIVGSVVVYFLGRKKQPSSRVTYQGNGGSGGNARVGGNGIAVGGIGGRSGALGSGGSGGDASVAGDGVAVGGTGGDAGVDWRPSLGGPSPLEQMQLDEFPFADIPVDEFGFMLPGRGGIGGNEEELVKVGDKEVPLVPMLRYLNYWFPATIASIDLHRPADPQNFWDLVRKTAPSQAFAAEAHVIACLTLTAKGETKLPSPYVLGNRH